MNTVPLTARVTNLFKAVTDGRLREPLGAYEKARINRFQNEIHAGRMTSDDAQQAIAAAWIAEYGPRRSWLRLLTPVK